MRLNSIGYIILLVIAGCGDSNKRALKDIESEAKSGAKSETEYIMPTAEKDRAAQEGIDCGAYYVENWGESISSLVHDNFQHVDNHEKCDVYLETVETSWGTLYRTLIFFNRHLEAVEVIAVSRAISVAELGYLITAQCFVQHGDPLEMGDDNMDQLTWIWDDPNSGTRSIARSRTGAINNSVFLFVGRGGSETELPTYLEYTGAGDILSLEALLLMNGD